MQLDFNVEEQTLHLVSLKKVVADSVDYLTCKFTFSEDWDGVTKSATFFPTKGEPYTQILEDDGCVVPHEVIKTPLFKVSVFGGDLITTNKVIVGVVESGYVIGETPKPPTPDVYAQILNKVSESEKNTEDALKTVEEKVEEVDGALEEVEEAIADTQTAIDEVNNAKNMAIDVSNRAEKAIENTYIAIENAEKATEGAQRATESVEAVIEDAEKVIEEAETVIQQTKDTLSEGVANALKGTTSGEAIGITDISPIEHNMGVSVKGKNLINNNPYCTSGGDMVVDGATIAMTKKATGNPPSVMWEFGDYRNFVGKTLTFSVSLDAMGSNGETNKSLQINFMYGNTTKESAESIAATRVDSTSVGNIVTYTFKLPERTEYGKQLVLRFYANQATTEGDYITISNVQLEEGTIATNYAPYIEDISTVKLYKSGDGVEPTVYDVPADGIVEGVKSLYPSTTLYTDTSGAVIDCTYNRDINKAFAELQNAIIAIGGLE